MLKQLKLRKKLELWRKDLTGIEALEMDFQKRSTDLEQALEEAQTDEDFKTVNESIEALEQEVIEAAIEEKKTEIQAEIKRIEDELAELDERHEKAPKKVENRGDDRVNRLQVREMLKNGTYYERSDVKEFYEKVKNLRAVTGQELTIPEVVINRIMDIVGDFTTVYPLVDKVRVKGKARILLDTDTTAATWIEQTGTAIPNGDVGTIVNVDFDGWKVGKIVFVDNAMLQDSMINLDEYVTKKIARAIAKALDMAIINGTGAAGKQPQGIIPSLSAEHKVDVTPTGWAQIVEPIGLIDTGEDSVGEIVAVMNRKTYYSRLLEFSVHTTASGDDVGKLPNLRMPDLLGLRVVFNTNVPVDKILFGEFSKYTLVEREDISIDNSIHVKFAEDQTAFRGKGRFDGKPVKPEAFVLVNLVSM